MIQTLKGLPEPNNYCHTCDGTGRVNIGRGLKRCPRCAGSGLEPKPKGHNDQASYFSDTSQAAYEQAVDKIPEQARRVLAFLVRRPKYGATFDEIEHRLRILHQSTGGIKRWLVDHKKITDSGLRRKTRSGRGATVWVAL